MTSVPVAAFNSSLASCSCKTQFAEGSIASSSELRVASTRLERERGPGAWYEEECSQEVHCCYCGVTRKGVTCPRASGSCDVSYIFSRASTIEL